MRYNKLLIIAMFFAAACTTDPAVEPGTGAQTPANVAEKLVNTSQDAVTGSLIVYFGDDAVSQIKNHVSRASGVVVTRSGIANVDDVLNQIGVTSFRRLFPYNAKHDAEARAAGLDKWYVLNFPEDVDLDQAATKLAGIAEVNRVEFNTKLQLITDPHTAAYQEEGNTTRATTPAPAPFNDPELYKQWDVISGDNAIEAIVPLSNEANVDVAPAWKLTAGDPSVIVAVMDMGVKYTHPDLADNMWVNTAEANGQPGVDDDGNGYIDDIHGYNFYSNSPDITWGQGITTPTDDDIDIAHGTHVAGTIAAVNNNGIGICGIAGGTGHGDGVKIMSCQNGGTSGIDVVAAAEGFQYAADNGASIAQNSWGNVGHSITSDAQYEAAYSALKAATDYFIANAQNPAIAGGKGGIIIFAAGNDATSQPGYPGAYHDYISVTAFGPDFLPASYTNYGPGCNISAPGGDVSVSTFYENATPDTSELDIFLNSMTGTLSTVPSEIFGSDYGYMQGTSMAAPHVSGVAALGISYAVKEGKTFTLDEFKSMLLTSVNAFNYGLFTGSKDGLNLSDCINQMGTGAIDAYRLLMQIDGTPIVTAPVGNDEALLSLDGVFGEGSDKITYLSAAMSPEDMAQLGMDTVPTFKFGKMQFYCTKPGTAMVTVTAIAGGNTLGGGNVVGGTQIERTFAVIARTSNSSNGGWF